jgi:hypothetical protein
VAGETFGLSPIPDPVEFGRRPGPTAIITAIISSHLQPTRAYSTARRLGILPAQAYSSLSERQEARHLKSFGMQVPVGSNPTPSAVIWLVGLLSGAGGHNHGHKVLGTTQVSLGSMGDTCVGSS